MTRWRNSGTDIISTAAISRLKGSGLDSFVSNASNDLLAMTFCKVVEVERT